MRYARVFWMRAEGAPRVEPVATPSPTSSCSTPSQTPPGSASSTPNEFKTPATPSKRPATSPAEGTPSRIPVPRLVRGRGRGQAGRWKDETKMLAFESLCRKLEDEDECQYTLADLIAMMTHAEMYSEKHLERLLIDKYQGRVVIVPRLGKSSILCFLGEKFGHLGTAWYQRRCLNEQDERIRIVQKAAEIVSSDIRKIIHDREHFPDIDSNTSCVPESLTKFLHAVTASRKTNTEKIAKTCEVFAHFIISAARPYSFLSPIMLALGIWVHRKVGSKMLCDILHNLGCSVSYRLIAEYEKSAVLHSKLTFDPDAYMQFAFDNFDFNTDTIDGHGTVHSMGGMTYIITPKSGVPPRGQLPRLTPQTRQVSLSTFGVIPLQPYSKPYISGHSHIIVTDQQPAAGALPSNQASSVSMARQLDLLWLIGNTAIPQVIPAWNGFMSTAMQNTRPFALAATLPLPFVNLSPSDPTTISTCLHFAAEQASKHGRKFCSVTFDQPLYWKATEKILSSPQNSPLRNIFVQLGGFHLLMSFMGAIGHLMSGSGLEELWTTVYAKNSVQQMSSGKAYSRAVRAHFLSQSALVAIILQKMFEDSELNASRRALIEMCRALQRGNVLSTEQHSLVLNALSRFDETLKAFELSRTGKLWVQYIRMVELIRLLVRAERVGDWSLHLYTVKQMLPYFHAASHLNYAKSAHLYLQLMDAVESSLPLTERERLFDKGFFSIRKTNRLWAGNFSDQTIEMDLMRPMKSLGGITMHGRGITESTLAVFIRSMPYCSEVVQAFERFCGVSRATSEQHTELRDSSISRDAEHLTIFRHSSVNCDTAFEIGCEAMAKHVGKTFSDITLHRKDKAVPISSMTRSVTIREAHVQVNPTQLFHRIIVATKDVRNLENHFAYELSPYPTAIFDENGMRKTAKSKIVEAVEALYTRSDSVLPNEPNFVVDGGFLLRKVVWPRPATYGDVISLYVKHVSQHYSVSATVVFDGYPDGPTTKDPEHNLRAAGGTSADLSAITAGMAISHDQDKFLSNKNNKKPLIQLLIAALKNVGITVVQAEADADRLIVMTAIAKAQQGDRDCVVVGNDSDLLVLLIGLADRNLSLHFLVPGCSNAEGVLDDDNDDEDDEEAVDDPDAPSGSVL
ncbi:CaM kinase-like vesicle-associated protein [Frankliniella fusca]|uniref:CaM kinase-like vesicle-associated protein n=1 Tax=Frankliniella fusca TaxID=407009 RepID=A0AAE1H854_9NEOP|nr:CaM kinase-like vesicle-associated protein [Frankliniella fusca]